MTKLTPHLLQLIRDEGPLTVAQFMSLALGHPTHGYYATRDPLGAKGDFITAPEISQMFGEMIGTCLVDYWERLGGPPRLRLVELGPGRGTLMVDMMRVLRLRPAMGSGASVHMVEMSPVLADIQRKTLGRAGIAATWHEALHDVPDDAPLFLIANEFFDALPIRQLVRSDDGWRENVVVATEDAAHPLEFRLSGVTLAGVPEPLMQALPGTVIEICEPAKAIMHDIAARIARHGGIALAIDYGHAKSAAGDTLQAVKHHKFVEVLDDPGEADITAHVDFQALGGAATQAGAQTHGPVGQGAFLKALGIEARAAKLSEHAPGDVAAALERLTGEAQMGSLFKVMAVTQEGAPVPSGFAS